MEITGFAKMTDFYIQVLEKLELPTVVFSLLGDFDS